MEGPFHFPKGAQSVARRPQHGLFALLVCMVGGKPGTETRDSSFCVRHALHLAERGGRAEGVKGDRSADDRDSVYQQYRSLLRLQSTRGCTLGRVDLDFVEARRPWVLRRKKEDETVTRRPTLRSLRRATPLRGAEGVLSWAERG